MVKLHPVSDFEKRMKKIEDRLFKVLLSKKPLFAPVKSKSAALKRYGLHIEQLAEDLTEKAEVARSSMEKFLKIVDS